MDCMVSTSHKTIDSLPIYLLVYTHVKIVRYEELWRGGGAFF